MPFLLFLACASEHSFTLPSPSETEPIGEVGVLHAPSAGVTLPAQPPALTVTFSGEVDGFIELVGYDIVDGEAQWDTNPLSVTAIDRDTMILPLPDAPPALERGGDTAQSYAIALRGADADGEPGVYTGLGSAELVYVPVAAEGASTGWNLATRYGEDGVTWRPLEDGVRLGETLIGRGDTAVSGGVSIPTVPESRVALSTLDDATVADEPILDGWSVALPSTPDAALLGSEDGLLGSVFYLYAYDDIDGDATRTTEPILAEACAGATPVAVTWFGYASSIGQAKTLQRRGVRSGWDVVKQIEERLVPVLDSDRAALVLATSCG